jgi:hypothetical protein
MTRLERDIAKALKAIDVKIISRRSHRGHLRFVIETPAGAQHDISAAGTPTVLEHTVAAVVRDVRRLM